MAGEFVIDPVEPIHQFRKSIKRLRALVRLGREEDAAAARSIDRMLRDVGRSLGDARDAEVVKRTASKLCSPGEGEFPTDFDFGQPVNLPDQRLIQTVTDSLEEVRVELDQFIAGIEWSDEQIRAAIEQEIENAVRDMQRFSKSGHDEEAHDWRKRVQRCANQLRLVAAMVPVLSADQLENLNHVAEILGDYNDLTILRHALQRSRSEFHKKSNTSLRKKAKKHQSHLRKLALESGKSIGA